MHQILKINIINNQKLKIMETILKTFKVSENQKKYDLVQLSYDKEKGIYKVSWKWTSMKSRNEKKYSLYTDAIEKYKERKHFAIICN